MPMGKARTYNHLKNQNEGLLLFEKLLSFKFNCYNFHKARFSQLITHENF